MIVRAVDSARISHVAKALAESRWMEGSRRQLDERIIRQTAVVPSVEGRPEWFSLGSPEPAEQFVITYDSPHENARVSYVIGGSRGYLPTRDIFYVHVPQWASIRSVDRQELGEHVLGTAHLGTGEIRLLDSLDAAQRTEVLLHESLHLLYPMHAEGQIRDLVRDIMGKQYCHFH